MKKTLTILLAAASMLFGASTLAQESYEYQEQQVKIAAVDTYSLTMRLYVPRIYDNN